MTALKLRQQAQAIDLEQAGDAWTNTDLVFPTRWGTPIEPRNFYRSFEHRCLRAGTPPIRVHATRSTCASLLAALDVHPRIAMEVYTEVPIASTRAAVKRLGESLAEAGLLNETALQNRTGPLRLIRSCL